MKLAAGGALPCLNALLAKLRTSGRATVLCGIHVQIRLETRDLRGEGFILS